MKQLLHSAPEGRHTFWLAALALLALLLAGRAARAQAPAGASRTALNPDGSLRKSQAGSFDAKGYRMSPDAKTRTPVFRPTGAGDEN